MKSFTWIIIGLIVAFIAALMGNLIAGYLAPTFDNRRWLVWVIAGLCVLAGALIDYLNHRKKHTSEVIQPAGPLKSSVFQPGGAEMTSDLARKIETLVAQARLEDALRLMIENNISRTEALQLSGQLSQLNKDARLGIIAAQDADAKRARIAKAILDLLDDQV